MKCFECGGAGTITCPVCGGSKIDPRTENKPCRYCDSKGYIKCSVCDGRGTLSDDFKNL